MIVDEIVGSAVEVIEVSAWNDSFSAHQHSVMLPLLLSFYLSCLRFHCQLVYSADSDAIKTASSLSQGESGTSGSRPPPAAVQRPWDDNFDSEVSVC